MTYTTTPASIEFAADPRRTWGIQRVYEYCQRELDHTEVREAKAWVIADANGMDRGRVGDALDFLAHAGYVVEHGRDERGIRLLTLAWSVNPARRYDAKRDTSAA